MKCVSIIIPCYNRAFFLAEAIESALAQDYSNFEVVVVDDGSADNTQKVCENYPNIRYIFQENQGVSVARNTGINQSKGEYLVFLDSDDRLLSNALKIGAKYLDDNPNLGFTFGANRFIRVDGSQIQESPIQIVETADYKTFLACEHLHPPANFMTHRSAIESSGLFNPTLSGGEDTDFWLRIAQRFPVHAHNQIIAEKRLHDGQVSNDPSKMLTDMLHMLSLHHAYILETADQDYKAAYERGRQFCLELFGPLLHYQMIKYLKLGQWRLSFQVLTQILQYYPRGFTILGNEVLEKLTHHLKLS